MGARPGEYNKPILSENRILFCQRFYWVFLMKHNLRVAIDGFFPHKHNQKKYMF